MGVVYKAHDCHQDRLVALKFLSRPAGNAATRLLREARAISSVRHPRIATLHEVDQEDGEPFLVLEYLPGGSLRDKLRECKSRRQKLPLNEILEYALQIGEGLAHAHRHGIVHRDVKTDNVLFAEDGSIKITDFGLAKFQGGEHLTKTGHAVGTVSYMSPEQAQGMEADQRSDIFSFGIVLYELITGRVPFSGSHEAAVLYQVVHRPAPRIDRFRDDLPAGLRFIVEKAIEKSPAARYQSMNQLVADLRSLATVNVTSERTVTIEQPAQTLRFRRLWKWSVAALCSTLISLALAFPERVTALLGFQAVPEQKELIVLPFDNTGNDPGNQAFCDGIGQILTSKLAQLQQFQHSLIVVPAGEARKESVATVRQARAIFGVNLALTGNVWRTNDRVRLTVNLVDAKSLHQLRSQTLETKAGDVAALQDGVVRAVTEMLAPALYWQARRALSSGSTTVPSAYDYYVQGQGYLQRFDAPETLAGAIALFQKALEQDPQYALAQAALAEAYWRNYRLTKDPQWIARARQSCDRAMRLDSRAAPVYVIRGLIETGTGKHQEAVKQFERALKLDPASPEAYGALALAYEQMSRLKDAEAVYQRSIQLRPGYWLGYARLGVFCANQGRYRDAEQLFKRVIDLTPDNAAGYRNLGSLYHLMGWDEEAGRMLEKSLLLKPDPLAYTSLGTVYFFQGRYRDAIAPMEKAVQSDLNNYLAWGNLADAYRWTPERAFQAPQAYHKAIQLGERLLKVNRDDAQLLSDLALYHAKLAQTSRAVTETEKACRLAPGNVVVLFNSGVVLELAHERSRALTAIHAALKHGYSLQEVRREPELASLRSDPRFERMVAAAQAN